MTNIKFGRLLSIFITIISAIGLVGCAELLNPRPAQTTEEPGLYNGHGWNYTELWRGDGEMKAPDIDKDGEVGHPISVSYPTWRTVPKGEPWNCSYRVAQGTLPPGLTLLNSGEITGIPTERGHWIVTVEQYNVQSLGKTWWGFRQQIRFHITGSGKVVN